MKFWDASVIVPLLVAEESTPAAAGARQFQGFARPAKRKLEAINAAVRLDDLKVPPANRLEKLKGNLKNFYSIRINDQWRVIFRWVNGEAHDVRITDYH